MTKINIFTTDNIALVNQECLGIKKCRIRLSLNHKGVGSLNRTFGIILSLNGTIELITLMIINYNHYNANNHITNNRNI